MKRFKLDAEGRVVTETITTTMDGISKTIKDGTIKTTEIIKTKMVETQNHQIEINITKIETDQNRSPKKKEDLHLNPLHIW